MLNAILQRYLSSSVILQIHVQAPLCFSMEGGELFQRIQDRQDGAFTERGK